MSREEEDKISDVHSEGDDLGPVWKRFSKALSHLYPAVLTYIAIIFIAMVIWVQFQTPLYKSTATILIDPTLVTNKAEQQSLENLALQATLIQSPGVLNKVIDRFNLKSVYPFNKEGNPMKVLQDQMTVKPNLKSKTIEVSFLFLNADEGAKIANGIAETYVYSSEEKSQGSTQESLASLQLNYAQEIKKLEAATTLVEDYKKKFPEIEDDAALLKQADYLNSEVTKSDGKISDLKTKIVEIEEYAKETGGISNHPYILDSNVIDKQMDRVRAAQSGLEELKQQFREMHPDVILAKARLESLKKSMIQDETQIFEQFKIELKTMESAQQRMRDKINEIKEKAKKAAPQKAKLKSLMDDQESVQKTIKLIQDRMSLAAVEGGLKRPGVTILNLAKPADEPYSPNKPKILGGGFVFSLFSSLGLIFLLCYFDRSIRSYEDIEIATGKLFLGDLPFAKVKRGEIYPEFPNDKSFILFTHGLRLVATNIEFVLSDRHQKCVLFTSSMPGEGKSFVSFHIAQSMARQGKKVILIDADFCQPGLRDKIPKTECTRHLHEYLAGNAEIGDIIEGTDNELVDFIRSGGRSAFSAPHALKSNRMKELLATLKQHYDYVLIDTPPVLPVNDTIALSMLVDMRVVIVKWGSTHRDLVRKGVAKIAPGQLALAGVVLNQVKEISDKGYHIYHPN